MGFLAGKRPSLGIAENGELMPVDHKPRNSVSSFATAPGQRIAPLAAGNDPLRGFQVLANLLETIRGTSIVTRDDHYIRAEFKTRHLGFVDDVEFLLEPAKRRIHVRSASRLGRSDLGTNRRRIEALRRELADAMDVNEAPSTTIIVQEEIAALQPTGDTQVEFQTMPNGLQYADLEVGDGETAVSGDHVSVHYTGWLYENGQAGSKFDSSKDRGQPFQFPLGAGHVIKGWDEGVAGMQVGGKRQLIIPPDLGYGAQGAGGVIPPNATLLFEVELLGR